jgi:hypothetical protein
MGQKPVIAAVVTRSFRRRGEQLVSDVEAEGTWRFEMTARPTKITSRHRRARHPDLLRRSSLLAFSRDQCRSAGRRRAAVLSRTALRVHLVRQGSCRRAAGFQLETKCRPRRWAIGVHGRARCLGRRGPTRRDQLGLLLTVRSGSAACRPSSHRKHLCFRGFALAGQNAMSAIFIKATHHEPESDDLSGVKFTIK